MLKNRFVLQLLLLPALLVSVMLLPAMAQSEEEWTLPVNLSNSGSANTPSATIDINGVIHVLWSEPVTGILYSRFKNDQWSTPRILELVGFRRTVPTMVSTKSGYILAFWINEKGELSSARVVGQYFGDFRSWSSPARLDVDVNKFDVITDSSGAIQIAYIKTSDDGGSAAGIYFRRSLDEGIHWFRPSQIYTSAYLRSIDVEAANIQVASTREGAKSNVFVVWDNPARKQVFFARSLDGGGTFEEPIDIDRPDLNTNSVNPFHIRIGATLEHLVLVWQNGDPDAICTQFYSVSKDAGKTWDSIQPMLLNLSGCATENRFLPFKDRLILQTVYQNQTYLIAYNGEEWSTPQLQQGVSNFEDPVTLSSVSFGCRQIMVSGNDRLSEVGCDTGFGGDVWFTQRVLANTDDWFLPPSIWSYRTEVISRTVEIHGITMISDNDNRVHALWSVDEPKGNRRGVPVIEYSRLENESWSEPNPVLRTPDGKADQPAIALDSNNHLIVGWTGGVNGEIYVNSVDPILAFASERWTNPIRIPNPQPNGSNPSIVAGPNGELYLAFSVPLNEDRGIYITKSKDGGITWSDAIQVFDGVAMGWEMIGELSFARTGDGVLHLAWTRDSLPGGIGGLELYYSRSVDDGESWQNASQIAARPILWSKIVGLGNHTVHILWQEDSLSEPILNHEYSTDSGAGWSKSVSISSSGDMKGALGLAVSPQGNLNLVKIVRNSEKDDLVLQHYSWDGEQWNTQEDAPLDLGASTQIDGVAANISNDGYLNVLCTTRLFNTDTGEFDYRLVYTSRQLDIGEIVPFIEPTAIPTQIVIPTPTLTVAPLPTPTIKLENPVQTDTALPLSNSSGGLVLGVGLAVFIVVGAFITWTISRRRML